MKKLMGYLPPFLLAFLCGVFIASLTTPPEWFLYFITGVAILLLASSFSARNSRISWLVFVCLGLLIGLLRFEIWDNRVVDGYLDSHIGETIAFEGVVIGEPDTREGKTRLTVALLEIKSGTSSREVFGTALVIVNRYPEYHYGDKLSMLGKLSLPKVLTEEDGRVFDYPAYLRSKGIRYQMIFPHISLEAEHEGNPIVEKLLSIKAGFEEAIGSALPSPQSALLSGLLLGGKQSLGETWLERFRVSGIVHIVVLSGYNMTIVAEWLVVLFRSLGFYGSLSAGSVGIMLFAVMTGGGATVLRAAIMALIVLLSKATGRNYDMGRALLVAASLMVLENPSILLFDPSFQLSFLASLGLIFVSPIIERRTTLFHTMPIWREVFISTLATQVVVLPLLLAQTGMISLVSLPANLFVLPLIPLTMLMGFAAGLIAIVSPAAAVYIGLPAYGLLSWILEVAERAAAIPFAAVEVGNIPGYFTCICYVVMAFIIHYERKANVLIARFLRALKAPPSN